MAQREGNVVESVILLSDRHPHCRGYTAGYLGNGKLVGQFADGSKGDLQDREEIDR